MLLNFWSTTCSPCVDEIPFLRDLDASFRSTGLVIVGVSGDVDRNQLDEMVKAKGIRWPQVFDGKGFDGEAFGFFNVVGTPKNIVIDRRGKIVARIFAASPEQRENQIRAAVVQALQD